MIEKSNFVEIGKEVKTTIIYLYTYRSINNPISLTVTDETTIATGEAGLHVPLTVDSADGVSGLSHGEIGWVTAACAVIVISALVACACCKAR